MPRQARDKHETIQENQTDKSKRGRFVKHSRFKAPKADDSQAIYALASLVQPRRLFLKSIGVQAAELKTAGTYSGEY